MKVRIPPGMRRTLQLFCTTIALALYGGSALLCTRAFAETALILPPGGDADEASARTLESVVLEALRSQGFAALLHRELAQTNASVKRCVDLDCASNLPSNVRADLLVALALWKRPDSEEKILVLTLRDNRGRYPVQTEVRGSLSDAAQQAVLSAQSLRLLGPGPWIALQGSPLGAEIELDGKRVGTLPLRAAIASGPHELRVAAAGFEPHLETVHMPLKTTQLVEFNIALQAVEAEATATPRETVKPESSRSTTPSAWNYAAGGVLAAGAIALAIDPIRNALRNGDCVGDLDQDQSCSSRVYFGGRSIGLSVAAFALALGSGYFFAFQPIHIELDAAPGRAAAQLRAKF